MTTRMSQPFACWHESDAEDNGPTAHDPAASAATFANLLSFTTPVGGGPATGTTAVANVRRRSNPFRDEFCDVAASARLSGPTAPHSLRRFRNRPEATQPRRCACFPLVRKADARRKSCIGFVVAGIACRESAAQDAQDPKGCR